MKYLVLFLVIIIEVVSSTYVSPQEWNDYKNKYQKQYDPLTENRRRINYAISKSRIRIHNLRFERNQISYDLGVNRLSDMSDLEYNNMLGYRFQDTIYQRPSTTPPPSTQPPVFPFQNWTGVGAVTAVKDQGSSCNYAWAHAAIAALESRFFIATHNLPILSEQQLIDCSGTSQCRGNSGLMHSVRTAYNYIKVNQNVNTGQGYPKNPAGQIGPCHPNKNDAGASLADFVEIADNDDAALKNAVYEGPVVIGFNPFSFEFRHYKSGIFVPPRNLRQDFSKYYVTVVGYDNGQSTNKPFWILKNSMGADWGESGYMRLEMNSMNPITKSAIYPIV